MRRKAFYFFTKTTVAIILLALGILFACVIPFILGQQTGDMLPLILGSMCGTTGMVFASVAVIGFFGD